MEVKPTNFLLPYYAKRIYIDLPEYLKGKYNTKIKVK